MQTRYPLLSFFAAVAVLLLAPPALAQQNFRVLSSTPADGSAGVALSTTVSFLFENPIPDSISVEDLFYDEEDSTTVPVFPPDSIDVHAASISADRRTISLDVTHTPDTDFVWLMPGLAEVDGEVRLYPYALNYTTAATSGPYEISGTVSLVGGAGGTTLRAAEPAEGTEVLHGLEHFGRRFAAVTGSLGLSKALATDPRGAVMLAIDLSTGAGGATVIDDASGVYAIPYLRDGFYFVGGLFARGVSDEEGEAYFAFYDADADGFPDTIVIDGASKSGIDLALTALATSVEGGELPEHARLLSNYPNPFNPATTLPFDVAAAGPVRLAIYDVLGREVAVLVDGLVPAGRHAAVWQAAHAPSGLYLARLQAAGQTHTRVLVLQK